MKTNSFLFLAAASSMMLAACSKDNGQLIDDGQIRLSTANVISETRSTDQSLQLTQFANGEKVGIFLVENSTNSTTGSQLTSGDNVTVYNSGSPLEYTANGEGGLSITNAQYWPTSGNGLFIYGVYPSSSASAYTETAKEFSVKTDQSTDANYKASDLMTGVPASNPVSRTTSAVPLTFKHLLTKVNITLTAGAGFSSSDLASAEVYILNTKPTTTFSVASQTIGDASGSAQEITVCTGTAGSAIIVPQTLNANTNFIKVEVGGGAYIYKLAAQTSFSASSVYTYSITVNKTGLEVSSSITGWTSVGTATSGTATLQ